MQIATKMNSKLILQHKRKDVRDGAAQMVGRQGGKRQHLPYLNIKPKADWWDMHIHVHKYK